MVEGSSDVEVELYEEIIGNLAYNSPYQTHVAGSAASISLAQPAYQGPKVIDGRDSIVDTTETFAQAPWPTLRYPYELAEARKEPRDGVAAT